MPLTIALEAELGDGALQFVGPGAVGGRHHGESGKTIRVALNRLLEPVIGAAAGPQSGGSRLRLRLVLPLGAAARHPSLGKGTPSAHHRQEPYSAEQAIAGMDEAGVDRALIHPVLWDPDSNELAVEAVSKYPDRFAIMGWFDLDDPNGRDLVAHWKERPGMLGLRFYTNERHPQSWFTDGTLDWLWPAAERAQLPVSLGAAMFLSTVGKIAEL
jgi:predicted TIM-barrel fold metal-dependent hydrolase